MIIDMPGIMRRRFYEWAGEYLHTTGGKELKDISPHVILSYLAENGVFTLEEARAELDKRKIIVSEGMFELARYDFERRSVQNGKR